MDALRTLLVKEMRTLSDKIESGECGVTDEEAMQILDSVMHEAMSKEQVLVYLGWSRSKFDEYVLKGFMPKGRKRSGFKELYWYKNEIENSLRELRQ